VYVEKGANSARGNYTGVYRRGAAKAKKRKQRKLTSEEFLRLYEVLLAEGPKVKYLNPENYVGPR
jgi:hypothetical protein